LVFGGGIVLVAGLLALGLIPATAARAHLLEGQRAMDRGRAALLAGDMVRARGSFRSARASFLRASDDARNPLLTTTGSLPLIGRTPDAIQALARAGVGIADAALVLERGLEALPGGLAGLSPSGGSLPVRGLESLSPAVGRAAAMARTSLEEVRRTASSFVLGPVAEARELALERLAAVSDSLTSAAAVVERMPEFLGVRQTRRYFFGAQNPAELRGTGGLIGAYSILTIRDGTLSFSPFTTPTSLGRAPLDELPGPNDDYERNYAGYRAGDGFWWNINMIPDFPSAAAAVEASYERLKGVHLDGVILTDPYALAGLLEVTGPVRSTHPDITLDATDVVPYTTNQAYVDFPDSATRKLVLGDVSRLVIERFMGADPTPAAVQALVETATDGHLLLYSDDPVLQHAIGNTTVGGSFRTADGDFLSVVQNNAGANKVDFYQDRSITYAVQLEEDGRSSATAALELMNHAPASGPPRYVIGPHGEDSDAGENVSILNLYCGRGCRLDEGQRDGSAEPFSLGYELGHAYFQGFVRVPSGGSTELRYALHTEAAWTGNSSGGVYRLTFVNQPTIRPTRLRIEIEPPPGMELVRASGPLEMTDGSAVWDGVPGSRLQLEVRFRPTLPVRIWRDVGRWLSGPAIHL